MEILIAGAIFLLFASGVVMSILGSLRNERYSEEEIQAISYAEEGLEAIRSLKKRDFSSVPYTDGSGIIRRNDGLWELSGPSDTSGRYTRTVVVEPVMRNGDGNIDTDGMEDPSTKKVTVTVRWMYDNRPESFDISAYLTDWEALL